MGNKGTKIFGIGLNKTGTRSLAVALRTLGFRTLHKGDTTTSDLVDRADRENVPLLTHVGSQYHAYLDVDGIVRRFADLDEQYSGSKFILTTAAETPWLESRENHVRANRERAKRGEYDGTWLDIDIEAWRSEREHHHAAVREYFDDRPGDLLMFNIRGGDGWDELAPFLNCKVPRRDFPWENRKGMGTYDTENRLPLARRQASYLLGWARRVVNR